MTHHVFQTSRLPLGFVFHETSSGILYLLGYCNLYISILFWDIPYSVPSQCFLWGSNRRRIFSLWTYFYSRSIQWSGTVSIPQTCTTCFIGVLVLTIKIGPKIIYNGLVYQSVQVLFSNNLPSPCRSYFVIVPVHRVYFTYLSIGSVGTVDKELKST